jgi:hypothetical protein
MPGMHGVEKMDTMKIGALLSFLTLSTLLAGCGGSGGTTGTMSLSVADTPVDSASNVVVAFTGVQLQRESGTAKTFNFASPKQIDLMATQNGNAAPLLDGVTVPAGDYQGIRLMIDASQSSITLTDGSVYPLTVPSGSQTGLKLVSDFSVAAGGQADFMIDFNLRKAVTLANDNYILAPALRLVDNQEVGEVAIMVRNTFMIGDASITSATCSPAVYVYSGSNVTPVDINTTSTIQPIETASLSLNGATSNYVYKVAFLAPGDYTVAVTCAANDDPTAVDTLTFSGTKNATVTTGTATSVDFP